MFGRAAVHHAGVLVIVLASCAKQPPAQVRITQPRDGDTVRAAAVPVVLEAQGVKIVPATDSSPGTAHHHLFLDTDVTPPRQKIPQGVTGVIHLGRGQSDFTFTEVAAGSHRVIAVLADWNHVPLDPQVVDTVEFVVQP